MFFFFKIGMFSLGLSCTSFYSPKASIQIAQLDGSLVVSSTVYTTGSVRGVRIKLSNLRRFNESLTTPRFLEQPARRGGKKNAQEAYPEERFR